MRKFEKHTGIVVPIDRADVDTDSIIPKQYLKSIERTGFGPALFDAWRYLDEGQPGMDHSKRRLNPDFVLNQPRYHDASILLARDNYGCGSSREHAPWAMLDYGFHAVIAPSFADIFYNNCFKNGLLPIVLPRAAVDELFSECLALPGYRLSIDLPQQQVVAPGGRVYGFDIDPFRKDCLLKGLDDIGLTLQYVDDIRTYEARRRKEAPWLFGLHG